MEQPNDSHTSPVSIEIIGNGRIKLDWGTKDPFDFITLSKGQASDLASKLNGAVAAQNKS